MTEEVNTPQLETDLTNRTASLGADESCIYSTARST